MKYKLLRYSLLSLLVMLCGNVFADVTTYTFTSKSWDATDGSGNVVSWTSGKDGNQLQSGRGIQVTSGVSGANATSPNSFSNISKIVVTYSTNATKGKGNVSLQIGDNDAVEKEVTNTGGISDRELTYDYEANQSGNVKITVNCTENSIYIKSIAITDENVSDTRTATTLSLGQYDSTGEVSGTIGLPTATVMAGENSVEDALVTWTSSNENVAVIRDNVIVLLTTGTSTITATYDGDNGYKGCTASYTLTVTAAPYTSIAAMLSDITNTKTNITFNFTDMVVTYVNGNYTYVHQSRDGDIMLYGANLGLTAEKVYTGTLKGQLYAYNGLPEIVVSSEDISSTPNDKIIMVDVAIIDDPDNLSNYVNKRCDIQAEYVSANDKNLTFKAKGKEFIVRNAFNVATDGLEAGKTYNLSGMGSVYNSTYQLYLISFTENNTPAEKTWKDIKVNLTSTSLIPESAAQWDDVSTGISVAEDGTLNRVAKDGADIVFNGKWHGTQYGWAAFTASVAVQGTVKITYGNSNYGSEVIVTNGNGEQVAKLNNKANNTWDAYNTDRVVVAYYRTNEPTTLNFSKCDYVGYFAVEAIAPEELPAEVSEGTVTFDVANVGAEGVAPAAKKVEVGSTVTIPANTTLFIEGKTLTAWTDGTTQYKAGDKVTVSADMTLIPVFTDNTVSLADRKTAVHLEWTLGERFGAPTIALEGKTGFIVTQADVDGKKIDVKMDIDATNGKFNNAGRNDEWAQVNNGTKLTIPSCKGAFVCLEAYGNITTTTIDGQADYNQGQNIAYTVASTAETIDIVIGDGSYYSMVKVDLPVVQTSGEGGQKYEDTEGTITWTLGNEANGTLSDAIKGAISSSSVSIGDGLTSTQAKYFDTDMIKYTPATSNAGNVEGVMIEYRVKTAKGVTFKPTKVEYAAVKCGTDNATYSWSYTIDGTESSISEIDPKPNLLRDNGSNSSTAKLIHSETITADACETFTFRFYISKTANNKQICIGNVIISGIANGEAVAVEMFNLTTRTNMEEAGTVSVYPISEQYEADSEVTLTASENFGYDFVNWTDALGSVLSDEAKFKYTMTADATVVANFKKVETYELDLTIDGTNEYMVTVSPLPTVVDEKAMYEAGTVVQLNANQYEGLVTFANWSDGDTQASKTIKMDADVQLDAFFAEADIIAGWDFYAAGNSGRVADFFAADNETAALSLINTTTGETQGWLDKSTLAGGGYESFAGAAVNWRTGAQNGDVGNWHWQTKVNAEAFTNINVQFQMLYNYNAYQTYNVEYSTDGENWKNAGSVTMSGTRVVGTYNQTLPADANNQKNLYIRMIADKTSSVDGTASANDGNTLAMFFITGTPKLVDDGTAPVLVSSIPVEGATGASATGKIVLNFDEKIKVAEDATASLTAKPQSSDSEAYITLTPNVNGKTITFEYKGLEYATTYYFLLNGNTVSDLTDNKIADPVTFSFTTMERPAVTKGSFDVVVENVEQLQAALKAAETRADQNTRFRIFLKNGTYKFPQSDVDKTYSVELSNGSTTTYTKKDPITYFKASNVSLIGESRDGVIITNTTPAEDTFAGKYGEASIYEGIGNSDVIQIASNVSGLYWQDLTVKTGLGDARGRDIAIQDKGKKNIYKNTCLWGYQDTWTSNNDNGLYYFEGGIVRGRTDFLCGKGDMFLNGVDIQVCMATGGYIAVPSKSIKYGFVFKDCTIKGESNELNGKFMLGRPWGSGTPIALWINTKMEIVPSAAGWNEMSGGWPMRFAEFNSMTANGTPVDLSGRKKVFGDGHENNPVLTAAEALEAGDLHNMFGEWDPTLATESAPAPKNVKLEGTTLTWDDSQYAFCWAIVKNDTVVAFTNEPTFTIDEATATWSVRAANEMGGLGEAVDAVVGAATAITNVNKTAVDNTIFDLQGRKVNLMKKGLYIIDGKKVVK